MTNNKAKMENYCYEVVNHKEYIFDCDYDDLDCCGIPKKIDYDELTETDWMKGDRFDTVDDLVGVLAKIDSVCILEELDKEIYGFEEGGQYVLDDGDAGIAMTAPISNQTDIITYDMYFDWVDGYVRSYVRCDVLILKKRKKEQGA